MIQKIKNNLSWKTVVSAIPVVLFLFFIVFMAVRTFFVGEVKAAVKDTHMSFASLTDLSDTFEDTLQENFFDRENYINLNGLSTKILGINTLNGQQRLANGYLAAFEEENVDMNFLSDSLVELNGFLGQREIPFLYVLAPSKSSFYDVEFAPGYGGDFAQHIDVMMDAMNEAGVAAIDMDAWYEENGWTMEETFFGSDLHWRPAAALSAAKQTMENLSARGLVGNDGEWLAEEYWQKDVYKNVFFGVYGIRTGYTYSGMDDISIYIPKFKTDYTYSGLNRYSTTWVYTDSPLNYSGAFDPNDHSTDYYHTYLYDDLPLQTVKNTAAANDMRVLILGDSFRLPFAYFLSTQFTELYTMDLRYYEDGTVAQYIEEISPDIVVMCESEWQFSYEGELFHTFGISDYLAALERTSSDPSVQDLGDFAVEAGEEDPDAFTVVCSDLKPGQAYTLTVDSASFSGDKRGRYVQMALQDLTSDTAVCNRYFESDTDEAQKWIFEVPAGSDTYAIYLYAGTKGSTAGSEAEAANVRLTEGIAED